MEFTQLNQFRTVAETENVVDASNILNISQPALTKSIKNLENELNVTLFDRTNHKLVLNEHGKLALSFVNEIFSDLNDMVTDLKFSGSSPDTIRICSSINAIVSFITPQLTDAFPSTSFYHQFRNIQKFRTYIEQGIFDLALSSGKIDSPDVENLPFIKDCVLISVPDASELYQKKTIRLSDLHGTAFVNVCGTSRNPLPALFENLLLTQGIQMKRLYMADLISLITFLKTSTLFSYTSSVGANAVNYGTHRRNIPVDPADRAYLTYYLSYHKDNKKRLEKYIDWFLQQRKNYDLFSERQG